LKCILTDFKGKQVTELFGCKPIIHEKKQSIALILIVVIVVIAVIIVLMVGILLFCKYCRKKGI
jgi:hypothetical protein